MTKLTLNDVDAAAKALAKMLKARFKDYLVIKVGAIPRGGVPAALAVVKHLPEACLCDNLEACDVIIDDLIDSGRTHHEYVSKYGKPVYALFSKKPMNRAAHCTNSDEWLVFPWEQTEERSGEDIVIRLLQFIGEDPTRGGLQETPGRVLKAWKHWSSGYGQNPADVLKTFTDGAEKSDEMVLIRNIPVYSHCEHHLAPFFGTADVAYIPDGRIVGLSKLTRLVNIFARRLQVQERLTSQIVDSLMEHLLPRGAGVVVRCRHMCMESRGIQTHGEETVTSALRGVMLEGPARAEFLALTRSGK